MGLITEELKIKKISDLLLMNVTIPPYQRPYRWSTKSTNTLFNDTYGAFKDNVKEYRLGSIILYREIINDKVNYSIVDGQQRLTTVSILLYCLKEENQRLLKQTYGTSSVNAIIENHNILYRRISELSEIERNNYKNYLCQNCTVVQIVTDNEQDAFQFFDSQNTRGKELDPHDLLKSYHLREMHTGSEKEKIEIIDQWENTDHSFLETFFRNYLYPITQWTKKRSGLGYNVSKIDTFKGINSMSIYNYSRYHKAINLYFEGLNQNDTQEKSALKSSSQFQLTQPFLSGKHFFKYTSYYASLLKTIRKEVAENYKIKYEALVPSRQAGDIYIKQLFECILLLFVDRFGVDCLTESRMDYFYEWCYSLRMVMYAVYPQTINKYALGNHGRLNKGLDMFRLISEMSDPEELNSILFDKFEVEPKHKERYLKIHDFLMRREVNKHG